MIRKIARCRVSGKARTFAKEASSVLANFRQYDLDECLPELARKIPYPEKRQHHSIIVLSEGYVDSHYDDADDMLATTYCFPIHLPKGAKLWQGGQRVALEVGQIYSFNKMDYHQVSAPDTCRTYAAFVIVAILDESLVNRRKEQRLRAYKRLLSKQKPVI